MQALYTQPPPTHLVTPPPESTQTDMKLGSGTPLQSGMQCPPPPLGATQAVKYEPLPQAEPGLGGLTPGGEQLYCTPFQKLQPLVCTQPVPGTQTHTQAPGPVGFPPPPPPSPQSGPSVVVVAQLHELVLVLVVLDVGPAVVVVVQIRLSTSRTGPETQLPYQHSPTVDPQRGGYTQWHGGGVVVVGDCVVGQRQGSRVVLVVVPGSGDVLVVLVVVGLHVSVFLFHCVPSQVNLQPPPHVGGAFGFGVVVVTAGGSTNQRPYASWNTGQ